MLSTVYHYTSPARAQLIDTDGAIHPAPHPWVGLTVVWLSTLDTTDRAVLGLAADHIGADRADAQIRVHPSRHITPWPAAADEAGAPELMRRMIAGPAGRPDTWYISHRPLRPARVIYREVSRP